jgi:hypothetical protein
MLTVLQHLNSVHPYILDARCILVGPFVSCMISDALWIENDDVGEVARSELPAVLYPKGCRRE